MKLVVIVALMAFSSSDVKICFELGVFDGGVQVGPRVTLAFQR